MSNGEETDNMPADDHELSAASDAAPAPAPFARPLKVGALLAESRAAAGRDLADISRETRVPLRHLMAIEADDHHSLPALPYALGFVKSYARSLGLNSESIAAQFRAETSITPHVPTAFNVEPLEEARLPSRQLAWGSVAAVVLLIGGLGLYGAGVFDPAPPSAPAPPPVVAEAEPPVAVPAPAPVGAPVDAATLTDPAATAPDMAAMPAAPMAVAPVPPQSALPSAKPGIPTSGPVVLVAQEDVWVKIYDRATGRRAFMGMLAAGQRYEVPADGPPLTLRAGRAGVVQVQVAGVALPSLGGPVSTIDGVVLTAPALVERFAPVIAAPVAAPAVQRGASPARPQSRPGSALAPARPTGSPIGD